MAMFTRTPFAEIGNPRLQALSSAKNRQNAINITPDCSLLKPTHTPTSSRKRRAPSVFEDEDSENVNPENLSSPSKKSKKSDAGFVKPAQPAHFSLLTSPSKSSTSHLNTPPAIPSVRKALSSPKPSTTNSTPISLSRGSPKHKRIGLLSKRRASSSPFRRVDPPSFTSNSSPGLPFSIDAALKGSIPDYTPKASVATPTPAPSSSLEDSMPKSWFFDIHEDTPEQEAANLMEHSASVLDISSDDDCETKRMNEDRGKENIPPPDFISSQSSARANANSDIMETNAAASVEHVKLPRLKNFSQDAMDEDREPLKDLPASDFYGEGCDATSYVTVDAFMERPSALSKEFDLNTSEAEEYQEKDGNREPVVEQAPEKEPIQIYADVEPQQEPTATPKEDIPAPLQDVPFSTYCLPETNEESSVPIP